MLGGVAVCRVILVASRDLRSRRFPKFIFSFLYFSDNVDPTDAKVCGSPGQVVDAEVLDKILKQPDHCRIFYGPGNVFLNYRET